MELNGGSMSGMAGRFGTADPKSKITEYLATHYGNCGNDIRNILNETKVGAWKKPSLAEVLNSVFSDR
jgi:hypothetical protein